MKKIDFNREWTVQKDGNEEVLEVDLPHDAMIYEKRSKDAPTAGASGYFYGGRYIYNKQWDVPQEWESKTILMECEGVYMNAGVLVNGEEVKQWPYGYTNFYVDLGKHLDYGKKNIITVIADNSKTPNTRWYSGSGIYREVHLYVSGSEYIAPEGVKVSVIDEKEIQVNVMGSFSSDTKIVTEILDGEKVIASGEGKTQFFKIENMKCWDAETPYLYQCRVRLENEGEILDDSAVSFGVRTIAWGKEGCTIIGKKVLLRGACIHHDNGILGACGFADAERRRIRILKEAGFNAIRSSHNPVSKAMMEACDTLGMYIIDESFDMWMIQKNPFDYGGETFLKWWKKDTEAMISKDFNHPAVIMYSIGNEISDLGALEGQEMCREMADFVRKQDTSRPVTLGINLMLAAMVAKGKGMYGVDENGRDKGKGTQSMDSVPTSSFFNVMMNRMGQIIDMQSASKGADQVVEKVSGILDIPGYNYATSRYRKEARKYPERAFVGAETLPKSLYRNWQLVKEIPNLIGDFIWTGWDYLGESGIGTIQYKDKKTKRDLEEGLIISGGPGVIDICGKMRPETGWNKAIWGLSDKPVIGVLPVIHADDFQSASMWRNTDTVESWSWEGCEGKRTQVTVYSNADRIELILNGNSLGKKKIKECKAVFKKVIYVPGKLEAVAYDTYGKELSRNMLKTAEGRTVIKLKPETGEMKANGQDLCYLNINLCGENGVTKSSVDQKITVTVEGSGTLQALGSARPHMAENFYSDTHTTYYGKALAIIRAGYEAGKIKVRVSGDGVEQQEISILVHDL